MHADRLLSSPYVLDTTPALALMELILDTFQSCLFTRADTNGTLVSHL